MPIFNNANGKKRRRLTNETPFNKRSQALDATGALLMERIQNDISDTLELLCLSLEILQLAILAWFLEILDDAAGLMVIQKFMILVIQLQQRVMTLMGEYPALVDIEPEDELPRGH